MATLSQPIAFTPTYADNAVQGVFTVMMQNNVSPQAGDVIQTVELLNNGAFGTLSYQIFQRNTDGSQGPSVLGPGTIKANGAPVGPVNVVNDNFQMISVNTGGPKGAIVEPPFIAVTSWSSS